MRGKRSNPDDGASDFVRISNDTEAEVRVIIQEVRALPASVIGHQLTIDATSSNWKKVRLIECSRIASYASQSPCVGKLSSRVTFSYAANGRGQPRFCLGVMIV